MSSASRIDGEGGSMPRFVLTAATVACACAAQARDAGRANAIAFLTPVTCASTAGACSTLRRVT